MINHIIGLERRPINFMKEMLNIVNENDEIIGEETREKIHQDGLPHREIHVYFITPNKEIIFQHRAKDKDTYPDLLDATVGGHVEIGDSYEKTAIKETREETGVTVNIADFIFLNKTTRRSEDKVTGKINYAIRQSYVYIFKGSLNDLKIETGKSLGFEIWPIEKLLAIDENNSKKFIPYILEFSENEVAKFINELNN
jgi:isopentenyl-diphosphate Delta-isomerase